MFGVKERGEAHHDNGDESVDVNSYTCRDRDGKDESDASAWQELEN